MKTLHKIFSYFNISWGGANACIKHGCKEYCGYSPSEIMVFQSHRDRKRMFVNPINKAGD